MTHVHSLDKSGPSTDVVELNDSNFEELVLNSEDIWLVQFYVPWCGHCKNLKAVWKAAIAELQGKVKLGWLDTSVNTGMAGTLGIQCSSSIKLFIPGIDSSNYDGVQSTADILTWVNDKIQMHVSYPEVLEAPNESTVQNVCKDTGILVLAILPTLAAPKCRGSYLSILKQEALQFMGYPWKWMWAEKGTLPAVEKHFSNVGLPSPSLVVISGQANESNGSFVLKNAFNRQYLDRFFIDISGAEEFLEDINPKPVYDDTQCEDAVVQLTDSNFDTFVSSSDDVWLVEFYVPWCGHCKNMKVVWKSAASELKSRLKLGSLDTTVNTIVANKLGIQCSSAIKLFDHGVDICEYVADQTIAELVACVIDKVDAITPAPSLIELVNLDVYTHAVERGVVIIIAYLPNLASSRCRGSYLAALQQLSEKYKRYQWSWLWMEECPQTSMVVDLIEPLKSSAICCPSLIALRPATNRKAVLEVSFSFDQAHQFLDEFLDCDHKGNITTANKVIAATTCIQSSYGTVEDSSEKVTTKVKVGDTFRKQYLDSSCENLGVLDDQVNERRRDFGLEDNKKDD